jgi:hypothetical protein
LFFGALLLVKTGVGFARLEKIYEYYVRMGIGRLGSHHNPVVCFNPVWRQKIT